MTKRIKSGKKQKNKIGGKTLKDKALEVEEGGTDHLPPYFSFKHACSNHFQLSDWQSGEIAELMETFRRMEQLNWHEIHKHRGLNYKQVDPRTFSKDLPEFISPDLSIYEVKVTKRARLFGYRLKNIFHIIWFDRNHEVYSMS